MDTFKDIIDAWPSRKELAKDCEVKVDIINKWYERDAIPAHKDVHLVECAPGHGIDLSFEKLARMRSRRKLRTNCPQLLSEPVGGNPEKPNGVAPAQHPVS